MSKNVYAYMYVAWKGLWITEKLLVAFLGRKPRNGRSLPRDSSDVNIMNFISVASLFVIMVWLINDAPDSLIADPTVSASVE